MNLLKASLFAIFLSTASLSQAELISNVPLDVSRYEMMSLNDLTNHAARGNDHAQFYLALRYQEGIGMDQNLDKAIEWYTKAANQDVTPAQLNLGLMYAKGEGVATNEVKARYWLERAAHRGDNRASFTLALIEENQDKLVDAYKWYELSARDGMLNEQVRTRARGKIGELALNLSSSDINNARNQADTWFQTN